MIQQLFADLKNGARQLKKKYGIEYDKCNVEVMLDGYCAAFDNDDAEDKNLYMSGLMLRFWYLCNKLRQKSPGYGNDTEVFAGWLFEGIEYACKYRAWKNPEKKVNGMQAVHRCVETIRLQHHYDSNLDKHKANYNTMSLEDPVGDGDSKTTFMDMLEGEEYAEKEYQGDTDEAARELVQVYVDQKKLVEAVILDLIAFNDLEHEVKNTVNIIMEDGTTKKSTTKYREFWAFKCVQMLHQLPEDYLDYFVNNYNVSPVEMSVILSTIEKANNQKLYKFLRKTLANAQMTFADRRD